MKNAIHGWGITIEIANKIPKTPSPSPFVGQERRRDTDGLEEMNEDRYKDGHSKKHL